MLWWVGDYTNLSPELLQLKGEFVQRVECHGAAANESQIDISIVCSLTASERPK